MSSTEVLPAFSDDRKHQHAQGEALLAAVVRFVTETGDGEFAMRLWNALELLPEVGAHFEYLAHRDIRPVDELMEAARVSAGRILARLAHENPSLFSVESIRQLSAKVEG